MNGILSHTLEMDDTHAEGVIHPGCVVIPAAIAVAEKTGASGRDLLTAIIVGYEVAVRVAIAVGPVSHRMKSWHATGTCGAIGAAAAAGRLLGLDPKRMLSALGLAGVQHTGTWIFTDDGSMCKRFHAGFAALGGVTAAYLAQAGFTGPSRVLEAADGGFFMTTSDDFDSSRVVKELGQTWESYATAPKPYSVCRHEHSTLFGIMKLAKQHNLGHQDIQEVHVKTNSSAFKSVGKIVEPKTIAEAQFSLPFAVGLALRDGEVFHHQFRVERLSDPEILAVARKVRVAVDSEIDRAYPARWSSEISLVTSKGTFKEFVAEAPGELGNPLSIEFISEKFRTLARASLSPERIKQVEAAVLKMESQPSAGDLAHLLRSDVSQLEAAAAS